jgi:2-iminobutanoate/2-iminopropanoate deaminase
MKFIQTDQAPKAIGPYSQAILVNQTLYVSGQLPLVPNDMTIISGDIAKQTEQCLSNLLAIVQASGLKKTDIVRCGVFLKDMNHFAEMNKVYEMFFGEHKPTRAAVEVARLPKDVLIEIDAIAVQSI